MNKKASNQFFVPHNVLEEERFIRMNKCAQILYIHLCRLKNRLGQGFYRDMKTLSRDTNIHVNTLKKAKKELLTNHYIDIERDHFEHGGYRTADRYFLNGYRYLDKS